MSVHPKPTIEMKRKLRCGASCQRVNHFSAEVEMIYAQDLLPSQYAHISLIGSRSEVLGRNVGDMVRVFFVPNEDRLDFPIAAFEVVQLDTLGTLRLVIHSFG